MKIFEYFNSGEHIIASNGNTQSGEKSILLYYPNEKKNQLHNNNNNNINNNNNNNKKKNNTLLFIFIFIFIFILLYIIHNKVLIIIYILFIIMIILFILSKPKQKDIDTNTDTDTKLEIINKNASDIKLIEVDNIGLTFGEIMALGGDYYGDVDNPISDGNTEQDREKQFLNNFKMLSEKSPPGRVEKLLKIFNEEIDSINIALKAGKDPSLSYLDDTVDLNVASGGGSTTGKNISKITGFNTIQYYPEGDYLKLATKNWDHFADDNGIWKAYSAGHNIALKKAASSTDINGLNIAYAYDAFACHFLSDNYSSGHLRPPRKKLHEVSFFNLKLPFIENAGDYYTKIMHDEDSRIGITVSNNACYATDKMGVECKTWKMYGDTSYANIANKETSIQIKKILQESVNNVFQAFITKKPIFSPKIWLYLPNSEFNKYEAVYGAPVDDQTLTRCINKGSTCFDKLGPFWKNTENTKCISDQLQCNRTISSQQRTPPIFFTDDNKQLWGRKPSDPYTSWKITDQNSWKIFPTYFDVWRGKDIDLRP